MEEDRKLPNQIQRNYGREKYEQGYAAGYRKCLHDIRRRKSIKEANMQVQFKKWADWLEDCFAANRR